MGFVLWSAVAWATQGWAMQAGLCSLHAADKEKKGWKGGENQTGMQKILGTCTGLAGAMEVIPGAGSGVGRCREHHALHAAADEDWRGG
jgi:hypothetical protein